MPCYWATTSGGLTVVGMNAWWVEDEMDYALKDSSPKVLICDEERLHRFEKIRADFPDLKYSPCAAMGRLKTRGLKQH